MSNGGLISGAFAEQSAHTGGIDLSAKGDMHGYSDDDARIPISTNNFSLLCDSAQSLGLKWAASPTSLLSAAGDILYASGANTLAKLAKGDNDKVLTLKSGLPSWESAAGGGGIVEVLGRDTLTSPATSMEVTSFTAKKYLQILTHVVPLASGNAPDNLSYAFNDDTSSGNYSYRAVFNDAEQTGTSQDQMRLEGGSGTLIPRWACIWVVNVDDQQKLCFGTTTRGASSSSTAPQTSTASGLWDNEADQITRVRYQSSVTNTQNTGSELLILGWD